MPHRSASHAASRRTTIVALLAMLLIGASTAVAYWTTGGAGTGSGATGSAAAITLSPGTPTTQLYPGGQSDVAVSVDNPNPISVKIGSLSLSTGQGAAGYAVDHPTCSTAALSFTTQTNGGAGWSVPPKVGSVDGSLTIDLASSLAMSTSAANACQGATFTVYLTAGP
jgi:hypothetical protein